MIVRIRGSPFDPGITAVEMLVFPDRCDLLDALDGVPCGSKRVSPMRRRGGNHDAGFADLDPADPMMDRESNVGPAFPRFVGNPAERSDRERSVRLIVEPPHRASSVVVPNGTDECRDRATTVIFNGSGYRGGVELFLAHAKQVAHEFQYTPRQKWLSGPCPRPMAGAWRIAPSTYARAARMASISSIPFARFAAIADARVQPVP